MTDLLAKSDGRGATVATEAGGTQYVTLRTAGVQTHANDTNFFEQMLDLLASPNIAFLLLSLGSLALVSEIFHPTFFAGIFGVIALILAYFSLGALPTNWAGVGLVVLGFALITAEIFVSGFGALGVGGVIALVFGGMIMMSSGGAPGFEVSRWLVISIAAVVALFLLGFVGMLVRLRRRPAVTGGEALIGAKGVVRSRLDPKGTVQVAGERWDATAEDPPIEEDAPVIVTQKTGLRLHVKRDPASIPLLPAPRAK
jgi:membrane-bound serine protease (ClpP class)